ncbi:caspase-14-like [Astyanax mexicanus]|uniref:Caspase-14-like n=1 Tax=Astyanax mexicanus TaxID=7994 RepID=A0A8T2KS50_ASTMX|nr:caspase-14-like [Astyanax mexicanus]
MAAWSGWTVDGSTLYSMEGAKIGLMFCVETENAGAPRDMDIMDRFYRKFGFEGEIIRQPSKEFMLRSLQNLANYSPKPVSCILIAFSGHGDEKVGEWNESELVTADHQRVKVSSITSIFSETNCPRLKGVPKIFITDACRGRIHEFGVMHGSGKIQGLRAKNERDEEYLRKYRTSYRSAVINDMFAAYAATPGNPAYMDELTGGYLFFCIERVFLDHSTVGIHFMDLFIRVKQCFEKINSSTCVDLPLLTMNMESTFSHLLYLG